MDPGSIPAGAATDFFVIFAHFCVFFALAQLKSEEYEAFYGFTDLRGRPARRGRGSRRTANQVTAGECSKKKPGIRINPGIPG